MGGAENLDEAFACAHTGIHVILKNAVDTKRLLNADYGVQGVVELADGSLQLIVGVRSEEMAQALAN